MQKIYSVGKIETSYFDGLWQQHKQQKTLEMNVTWPDESYIQQFEPETTYKIQ